MQENTSLQEQNANMRSLSPQPKTRKYIFKRAKCNNLI